MSLHSGLLEMSTIRASAWEQDDEHGDESDAVPLLPGMSTRQVPRTGLSPKERPWTRLLRVAHADGLRTSRRGQATPSSSIASAPAMIKSDASPPGKEPLTDEATSKSIDPEKAAMLSGLGEEWDDKGRLSTWKEKILFGITVLVLVCLAVAMICVGVIPHRNYQNSMESVQVTSSATRVYYFATEEIDWTYTPGGKDVLWAPLEGTYVQHTTPEGQILGDFIKGHFVEYTDDTFSVKKNISARWKHLGLLGPIMHAEAGDTIEVWLRNMINAPVNLEPLGVSWNIQGTLGAIAPGLTGMFKIHIPEEAGPKQDKDQNSHLFLYRSAVNPTRHENSGLVGGIVITRKGEANPDGTPKGVDREIVTLYQIYNEIETEFAVHNGPRWTANNWATDRFTINGRSFGTLEGLEMNVGERVRWYVAGLGTENAMHNFHWHGNVLEHDGHFVDQMTAIPATTLVADMYPDNPGSWLFHCHVNSHLTGGMANTYTVYGPPPPPTTGGVIRQYYIAADEVEWDYAHRGGMACTQDDSVEPFNEEASKYLGPPSMELKRLGSNVTKAIFREYTDETFTTLKPRALGDDEAYLGFLGPLIRAQVGDTIRILLRNNLPASSGFPVTLHPHGVLYNKSSEGAPYEDGTSGYDHADDAVQPGQEHTYVWEVPERAGPGPTDPSSVMWMYHSHADETKDTWAGLVGAMVFTRRGAPIREDGSPTDIETERVIFFAAMDETQSLYGAINVRKYLDANATDESVEELLVDETFVANSLHRSINGFMYCNMPRLTLPAGARSRIHFMALGDIGDMHTPRLGAGGGFLNFGQRQDAVQMSAGAMHSVDVVLTQRGTWQLGCNVLEHEGGGIAAMYTVSNYTMEIPSTEGGVTRTYYLQAEEEMWDYAPKGYQKCTIVDFTIRGAPYLVRTNATVGSGMYRKAFYREYTDATFTKRVEQPPYMGIMGPLMAMEVGDVLKVVLKNNLTTPINFSPGGGLITLLGDPLAGFSVQTGETFTYEWVVPQEAGPRPGGMSSVAYTYSSTVDHWNHVQMGLEGLLVVTPKGRLVRAPERKGAQKTMEWIPNDVDYMIPLLWQVFDQNMSPWLEEDMVRAGLNTSAIDVNSPEFVESQLKHTINGYMYCNMPVPEFKVHSRVRIVFMSVGAIEGLHSPVVTKFPLIDEEGAHDSATLMPGYTATMDMIANYTGTFPMWCNVHDHLEAGMSAQYRIY